MSKNRMLKKILAGMLIALVQALSFGPIYAQSNAAIKSDASIQKVKQEVAKLNANGKNVARIKLRDGTKLKGYISQANEESFVITDKDGQKSTVSYANVSGVKKGGGLSKTTIWTLVGVGAAAGIVTALAISFSHMHIGRL